MKKYIALIAGILVSTHIYAESYVFGGKAQFLGLYSIKVAQFRLRVLLILRLELPNPLFKLTFQPVLLTTIAISSSVYLNPIS